jgi:PAS domain-containing protein
MVALDVTERKRAKERVRAGEAKYRSVVETIPAVTYVARPDDLRTMLYISPQSTGGRLARIHALRLAVETRPVF